MTSKSVTESWVLEILSQFKDLWLTLLVCLVLVWAEQNKWGRNYDWVVITTYSLINCNFFIEKHLQHQALQIFKIFNKWRKKEKTVYWLLAGLSLFSNIIFSYTLLCIHCHLISSSYCTMYLFTHNSSFSGNYISAFCLLSPRT